MGAPTSQVATQFIDPNNATGPVRMLSGVVTFEVPTLDQPYTFFARWLYVGVAGDISVTQWNGAVTTIPALVAGVWHPVCTTMINSVGTTASNILVGN